MWLILRLVMAQKKNTLCVRPLFRVRAKIEKKIKPFVEVLWLGLERHLFGLPLVRVMSRKKKTPFAVGLWLGLGKN